MAVAAWIKSKTADKYLSPIRKQMISILGEGSDVIEPGCGTGDFLLKASSKISFGLGIDSDAGMIRYANKQKIKFEADNVQFCHSEAHEAMNDRRQFDYAVASLFFHVPPWSKALEILNMMGRIADQVLICAFDKPTKKNQYVALMLDQIFTKHYMNFKIYHAKGYMEGLIDKSNLTIRDKHPTFDPTIKIYELTVN